MENSFHNLWHKKYSKVKGSVLFMTLTTLCLMIYGSVSYTYASSDAYDSGRDHGCDDAGISNPSDRYINQAEMGPSFHTAAFMDGYHAGFRECSGSPNIGSNDGGNGNNNGNVISEGNGVEDGKDEARSDFLNSNGRDKDPSCSPYDHTDAYCTAFKLAYETQWAYMWVQYDCSSGVCK